MEIVKVLICEHTKVVHCDFKKGQGFWGSEVAK